MSDAARGPLFTHPAGLVTCPGDLHTLIFPSFSRLQRGTAQCSLSIWGFQRWCWLAARADRAAVSIFCHTVPAGWTGKDVLAVLLLKCVVTSARVCKSLELRLELCPYYQGYPCRARGTLFVFLRKIHLGVSLFLLSIFLLILVALGSHFKAEFFRSAEGRKSFLTRQRLRSLCNPLCSYWEFRQSMDHDDS